MESDDSFEQYRPTGLCNHCIKHAATEVWRPVVGWEGFYEVSDLGRVKRTKGGQGARSGTILGIRLMKGYPRVVLHATSKKADMLTHRLVARAFIGPEPEGCEVNHKNGNKGDPRALNLEYVTRAENVLHGYRQLGRIAPRGEQHAGSQLTATQVRTIRTMREKGARVPVIAAIYAVKPSTIRHIVQRESWAWLK